MFLEDKKTISTCAVIVTFNRIDLLKRCVNALFNQSLKLDSILVVNNGSDDGTCEWLCLQSNLKVINQSNLGGSGGFYTGCKYAFENNFDFVWLMDDDGYPSKTAFENLMHGQVFGTAVLNSLVVCEDRTTLSFPIKYLSQKLNTLDQLKSLNLNYIIGQIHPFNGTLIPVCVFSKIGLPFGDMFIWGDEREYYFRIKSFGIPVITVLGSEFFHPIEKNIEHGNWDKSIVWRKYFLYRNMYRVIDASNVKFVFLRYSKYVFLEMIKIIKTQKTDMYLKFRILCLGYIHAIFGKYGITPFNNRLLRKSMSNYTNSNK